MCNEYSNHYHRNADVLLLLKAFLLSLDQHSKQIKKIRAADCDTRKTGNEGREVKDKSALSSLAF